MAREESSAVGVREAKDAILKEIVRVVGKSSTSNVKDLALAYRLLAGGIQPGSAVVDAK